MASPSLREWLREGPFTLGMSAGFFGFFAHTGFLSVLEDEGLLPARLAGASAGALVTGAWAAGLDAVRLADELHGLRRHDFWDPRPGLGFLAGRLFRQRLEQLLPVASFAECRAPVAVSVYDVLSRRARAVDDGPLAPALHASCAVPGMFHPVWMKGRPCVDGGVTDRPGIVGLPAPGARVLFHHLASRSPWRARGSASMDVPQRAGLTAVVLEGLPRVGPFRLEEGPRAFATARLGMRLALGLPADRVVRVA